LVAGFASDSCGKGQLAEVRKIKQRERGQEGAGG
jgi:hypothetical protein